MLLTEPLFIIPWYAVGLLLASWVAYDVYRVNTGVNEPLKPGFIIIVFFFSIIGLMLYLVTARPRDVSRAHDPKKAFSRYAQNKWKKAAGAAIHCVAGDGLGIFTAMVISRLLDLSFWHEFWFEYGAGFLFGWLIFQYWSMREMGHKPARALWKGGRAEFFSMFTVMAGMGYVMGSVTPLFTSHPPDPSTAAFWGFGMFGLLVGFVVTLPMNYWLIERGYKHGMGYPQEKYAPSPRRKPRPP